MPALGNVVRAGAGTGTDTSALSFGGYSNATIIGLTEELSTTAATANTFESKTDGNLVLANIYLNKNYADDTAAAAGGVPLGGLYRSGNFIAIRIQ